jgi:hypothetical protein
MVSGPPPKEPKGGVPVLTWADSGMAAKDAITNKNEMRRVRDIAWLLSRTKVRALQ